MYYAYLVRVEAFGIPYLIGLIAALALLVLPVFVGHFLQLSGMALLLLGTVLAIMPFAPSFVIRGTGARRSERFLRISGCVLAAIGVCIIFGQMMV